MTRPKNAKQRLYATLEGIIVGIALPIAVIALGSVVTINFIGKKVDRTKRACRDIKERRHVRRHRLPPSQPLANNIPQKTANAMKPGFLRLPLEIRLEIYRLALPPTSIFQPRLGYKGMHSTCGPLPSHWEASQHIRSDEDPPSTALHTILELGGSIRNDMPVPTRQGCVRYGRMCALIQTGEPPAICLYRLVSPDQERHYTDLMRTCRTVYEDVMDILYGGNTISFFGAEGVLYFANNSSPEGLPRIRYAHLAICIPSLEWNQAKQKRTVIDAVQCLNSRMTSLCQLDVEVALTEGQPPQPELFWAWLREVLGQLRGLDRLVLKVSVLHPEHPPSRGIADEESPRLKRLELDRNEFYNGKWTPNMEPLVTWNEYEYGLLKNEVGQPRLAE